MTNNNFNTLHLCFAFSGVEKNNDDVRKFHLTKSNKWDAPKDILLASKRQQITSEHA